MDAKIDIEKENDIIIIHLNGSFHGGDFDFPREIKTKIKEFVLNGERKILIDFEHVTFFGSDGIGSLTNGHYTVVNAGGRLVPYSLPQHIYSAFKIVGLDRVFQICDNKDDAIIYVNQRVKT